MPKFKEYIKKLEDENKNLVERMKELSHDRNMAERHYEKERINNDFLKREINEWKKIASHLIEQLVKMRAEFSISEDELLKYKGQDGTMMPF